MTIQTFNLTGTIVLPVSSVDRDNVVLVYDGLPRVNTALIALESVVSLNSFIKNYRAIATITTLEEVKLPDFKMTDSSTEKLYKTLDVEWKSPRKQLDLLIRNETSDWERVFSISLLNPSGYPFRVYSLLDGYTNDNIIELGMGGQIGVKIQDVGYGVLDADDELTLHATWIQEFVVKV